MRAMVLTLALALAGCDGAVPEPDAGSAIDAATRVDAGRPDGSTSPDSGSPRDAGPPADGGAEGDASAPDGGGETCSTTLPRLGIETVIGSGLTQPVYVTQPPGVTDALYVVEKWGRIQIVRDGAVAGTFLDLQATVCGTPCGAPRLNDERGLLGLAFHPDYASNGRFYVYYAPLFGAGRNVVAELRRSATDPARADASSLRALIDVADPAGNHNGGMLAFGPDGYLYAAMGDGGSACDPFGSTGNGQDLSTAFGAIHRLDVDAAAPHAAPGNPFTGAGRVPTLWSYGLRNPWRFSFDRTTGDLWIGDVGQDAYEEIDLQPRSSAGGENYGWRPMEGLCASGCRASDGVSGCLSPEQHRTRGFTPPVFVAPRRGSGLLVGARSIVGGYVYRGSAIPELRGFYLFGDSFVDERAALRVCDGEVVAQEVPDLLGQPRFLVSFGEDNAGELYMVGINGSIVRIVAR